jgi:hypothetical protein
LAVLGEKGSENTYYGDLARLPHTISNDFICIPPPPSHSAVHKDA